MRSDATTLAKYYPHPECFNHALGRQYISPASVKPGLTI